MKSNVAGMPKILSSSRQAPVSDRLRTVQATDRVPRKIFPDFNIRIRGDVRRSSIFPPARILDERYSLNLNECWSLIGFLQDTVNDELPWPPLVPMGHDARVIAGE
jgi:hypothetical protein